ncbi:hypothetical protein YC2023_115347 [Brassica napus]
MEPFGKYLHTYLSLSGPHLGYLYSTNSLFNSGLWLLEKLKSTQVIHQLTLTDDPDLRQTFFYKLCKNFSHSSRPHHYIWGGSMIQNIHYEVSENTSDVVYQIITISLSWIYKP